MSIYGSFFHLFLSVSRRLEATGGRVGSPLSVEASQILGLIALHADAASPISAHDIGRILNIEKSVLSRKLTSLAQRGLLTQSPSTRDKRTKTIAITTTGAQILRLDAERRDRQFAMFAAGLSDRERRDIIGLTRAVADNLGTPPLSAWSRDPLRVEVARVTRALGFLSARDLFGIGVPLEEAQLLSMVGASEGRLSVEALTRNLPYDRSKISRLLHSYARRGLLTIESIASDKRRKTVSLSSSGRRERDTLASRADSTLERAIGPLSAERRAHLQQLLERLTEEHAERPEQPLSITLAKSEPMRGVARAFALRELVVQQLEDAAPTSFVHPERATLVAFVDDIVVGIIEWTTTSKGIVIENLLIRTGVGASRIGEHLLEEFTRRLAPDDKLSLGAPYLVRRAKEGKHREILSSFPVARCRILLEIICSSDDT